MVRFFFGETKNLFSHSPSMDGSWGLIFCLFILLTTRCSPGSPPLHFPTLESSSNTKSAHQIDTGLITSRMLDLINLRYGEQSFWRIASWHARIEDRETFLKDPQHYSSTFSKCQTLSALGWRCSVSNGSTIQFHS